VPRFRDSKLKIKGFYETKAAKIDKKLYSAIFCSKSIKIVLHVSFTFSNDVCENVQLFEILKIFDFLCKNMQNFKKMFQIQYRLGPITNL